MRVLYLTHYNVDTFPFLQKSFAQHGITMVYCHCPVAFRETLNLLIGAFRAVCRSHRGDVIVSYMCSGGLFCWLWSVLLFRKVRVVSCNLSIKSDTSFRSWLLRRLYGLALKSRRFVAAVNGEQYGRVVRALLCTNRVMPVLHDYAYYPGYARKYHDYGRRIFCGGTSYRDWERAIRIARLMPQWQFLLVGCDIADKDVLPPNIKAINRLPYARFVSAMRQATVVLNCVRFNCPAGLIVMMQAAWEGKLIATNYNDVLTEYVTPERGIIAKSDEEIVQAIIRCHGNADEAASKVAAMQTYLHRHCSEQAYFASLYDIVMEAH